MRKKKNNAERFNKTMPNLAVNNDINVGLEKNQNSLTTVERKSYPTQVISTFEISFNNNTPQNENKFNNTQKIEKKNINISNNTNTNTNVVSNINSF